MTLLQDHVAAPAPTATPTAAPSSAPTPLPTAAPAAAQAPSTRRRDVVLAVLGLALASAAFGVVVDGQAMPADQAQVTPAGR